MGPARYVCGYLHRGGAGLSVPELRYRRDHLRPPAPGPHHAGHFRFWRQCAVRDFLLRGAANLPGPSGQRLDGESDVLGLAAERVDRNHRLRERDHRRQGVCGVPLVCRPADHCHLGAVSAGIRDDADATLAAAYLCRQLVLPRVHPGHGDSSRLPQPVGTGGTVQHHVVQPLFRCTGRNGAVVVWPQCRRFLPDGGLPRDDVLLRAKAGGPADLFIPSVDHPFLGAVVHVHVGRRSPPALDRAA